jgi:hypothetical protein
MTGFLKEIEKKVTIFNNNLDSFKDDKTSKEPFYFSGARGYIRLGGKPIGVSQDIRWTIQYNATPIYTIDAVQAWDIDVGTLTISAQLTQIMDPTKGPEADGLFHTMSSAIHQPFVEIQLIDKKLGTSLFFARGMFTGINGSVARGQLGTWNANFTGTVYQHYVAQSFKPYNSVAGSVSGLFKSLQNLGSSLTGGIF